MTSIIEFRRFIRSCHARQWTKARRARHVRLLTLCDHVLMELRSAVLADPMATSSEIRARVKGVTECDCRAMAALLLGSRRPHRRLGDSRGGRVRGSVDYEASAAAALLWSIPARVRLELEQESADVRRRAMEQWRQQMAAE